MVERSGVTIDGMRPARRQSSSRVIGFEGAERRRVSSANSTRRAIQNSASVEARRRDADFGLKIDETAKKKARLKASKEFLEPVSTLEFDLSSKELRPDYSLKRRDAAEAPSRHGRKKNKKKKSHKLRVALIVILIIVAGTAVGGLVWGDKIISKLTGGNSGIFDFIGAITSNVKLKTDEKGRTNVLIFGTSGYDMEGDEGNGVHDGAQLTDSIMLVSIDQESGDTAMVSLPRDLYVGNTCTSTGKVNEVYFCANLYGDDEAGGAEALKSVMTEIFGVEVQYRVHVDWAALVQIVDSLGGITVTLDEDIEDSWTGTYIKAGEPVTLNGERALGLARARHGTEMGDFTRGNSQQKILAAIQAKLVENGIDLGTALSLVDVVGDNVRMDFNIEELKTLFYLAKDMSLENMRQIPLIDYDKGIYYLSTAMMNNISYVVPAAGRSNYKDIQAYVQKLIYSDPAVLENPVIAVLNGSDIAGAAAAEKTKLEELGFENIKTDNAPEGTYENNYYLYDITGTKTATVAKLAEKYNTNVLPASNLPAGVDTTGIDVVVILGGTAE